MHVGVMALMQCNDEDAHTAHRFPFESGAGDTYDNYCPGRHLATDGQWRVPPMAPRAPRRKPHFFLEESKQSICGYGHRARKDLLFDVAAGRTVEVDKFIGDHQYRDPCEHCRKSVI